MNSMVNIWWIMLCVLSLGNLMAWFVSARRFNKKKSTSNPRYHSWRRVILWLSGIYAAGCAFRSFLPRIDVERICLVDSWLSSMMVGRSVATIAEICFISQCAILLLEAGKSVESRFATLVALVLVPMILTAEGFSWYATLTTHYLGSVVEESLWTGAGILLIASFIALWPHSKGVQRSFLLAMILFSAGYVVFMVTVDVPMYWLRWQADTSIGVQYLSLQQGVIDALKRYDVSFAWTVWRQEISWMTLYFTLAVWVSLYLAHAPNFKPAPTTLPAR